MILHNEAAAIYDLWAQQTQVSDSGFRSAERWEELDPSEQSDWISVATLFLSRRDGLLGKLLHRLTFCGHQGDTGEAIQGVLETLGVPKPEGKDHFDYLGHIRAWAESMPEVL